MILEAEKFCANVTAPKGNDFLTPVNNNINDNQLELLRKNDTDDDFFHITCHINSNLKSKIERSEFIELDRLLSKDSNLKGSDERRIELVNHGGNTYFAPVQDKEARITGIRKWEQAFRIYAAIYSKANSARAAEIWQYVYVINTAALSYQWDNVSFYDTTFRQLMVCKPWRSWAKTYVQGWNLAMRDPIGKSNQNQSTSGTNRGRDWHDDCCWRFNRNHCRDVNCRFNHRCTYCGSWGHGYYNCRKRLKCSSGANSRDEHRDDRRRSGLPQGSKSSHKKTKT